MTKKIIDVRIVSIHYRKSLNDIKKKNSIYKDTHSFRFLIDSYSRSQAHINSLKNTIKELKLLNK